MSVTDSSRPDFGIFCDWVRSAEQLDCGWKAQWCLDGSASHTITPPAFLSCSTLPPIAIRNRQGVKRRVSKRKGCKSKEIESKRNGFATRPRVATASGKRGAESSSLFAVSQFVVRSPRRLHCAAGTAALRVYETATLPAGSCFAGKRLIRGWKRVDVCR